MKHDVKNALQSKTIIGALIAMAATLAQIGGYDIGDPDLYINDVTAVVGTIFAIYGRVSATSRVKLL